MSTNLVERIAELAATLPLEKQQAGLQTIEELSKQTGAMPSGSMPQKSIIDLLAHTGRGVTASEIDEARHELWRNFPRKDF